MPGASVAARAEAERAQRPPNINDLRGGDGAAADDGQGAFHPARNGRCAKAGAAQDATSEHNIQSRNSWAALAEEDDDDCPCDVDEGGSDDGGGGHGGPGRQDVVHGGGGCDEGEVDAEELTEGQLRAIWQSHCTAVRKLEKDRAAVPPEVITSVKAQRDAAERRWRAAKAPHPLHKRMRWAEGEVRAAEAKEASRRRELETHLAETAARTREIEEKLAVDVARTARKRAALDALLHEGGNGETKATEKAALVALSGLGNDIGPALAAIIEKLGECEREQGIKQDLQILSTSLGRVEEVLRDGTLDEAAARRAPEQFVIGGASGDENVFGDDDGEPGDGDDGGRRVRRREAADLGQASTAPRWTQPSANAPWRRAASSSSAVEEARRLLQAGVVDGSGGGGKLASPSDTNDLAIAEQRRHMQAQEQMRAAIAKQQSLRGDPQRAREEDEARRRREQAQQEELRKHQEAAAKAAAEAEAESARQREASWARMSPEEREAAIKVRDQQAAVGAHIFGTQAASQLAGLVHQTHVQERALASASADAEEVDLLMQMSPEEFARWDQERQSLL